MPLPTEGAILGLESMMEGAGRIRLQVPAARELAEREGFGAVIDGSVRSWSPRRRAMATRCC